MPANAPQSTSSATFTQYEAEHRLAIVMYGGVSLAIYIGGIARELLGVVRATAPKRGDDSVAGVDDDQLTASERIYRRVASMAQGVSYDDTKDAKLDIRKRVSVDIISGTSAGGINGIFLAKALANDAELDEILKLWVEEGDLGKLLNDRQSVSDLGGLEAQSPPVALLNGERMYLKLLAAFDAMDRDARTERRYDPARVDLFVTTTDIRGEVINLPVKNAVAQEKRHRQRFHFTYDGAHDAEFANGENPTLAYAARCTSSFPFAFEPFCWNDAARLAGPRSAASNWGDRLMFKSPNYAQRPMGDGGYLDNKPFSYAIEELTRRQSALAVTRTMIYVEPDPTEIDSSMARKAQETKPDAIDNALAALISIPGYETVREDLQRVVERNARCEEFQKIERAVEGAVDKWNSTQDRNASAVDAKTWRAQTLDDLIEKYGLGYSAYHTVKVASAIDTIADLICVAGSIARPEISQVVRDLVREWTRRTYQTAEEEMELLLDGDIDYRLRKLSFLLRKAVGMEGSAIAETRKELKESYEDYVRTRGVLRDALQQWVLNIGDIESDTTLAAIAPLKNSKRKSAIDEIVSSLQAQGDALREILRKTIRPLVIRASVRVTAALKGDDPDVATLRKYCQQFENYDMVVFPMARNGSIDEGVEVGIVRVSPRDVQRPHSLRGMALGHFGAFLEDDWRRNDILWGRLDAAETIIKQLVPEGVDPKPIVEEAHCQIIAEQLGTDLRKRLAEAGSPKRDAEPRNRAERQKQQLAIEAAARSCINDPALLQRLFAEGRGYDQELNRERQLESIGRAGVITEKILRASALQANFPWPALPKMLAGSFAILAQIAVPRSFARVLAEYWGRLLALIFIAFIVGGELIGEAKMTMIGVRGIVAVLAVALLAYFLRRWTERRLLKTIIAGALSLIAIGVALWFAHARHLFDIPESVLKMTQAYRDAVGLTRVDAFLIGFAAGAFLIEMLVRGWSKLLTWWRRPKALRLKRAAAGATAVLP